MLTMQTIDFNKPLQISEQLSIFYDFNSSFVTVQFLSIVKIHEDHLYFLYSPSQKS